MRVAIDARELEGKPTGVGRYLSEILKAWRQLPAASAHEFILYQSGRGALWEQFTLPRLVKQARADALFAPAYSGPIFCDVPMVVTIHDVSFAAHPEWFGWKEGTRRRTLARLSARRACRVLTISEFSKREIVQRLGVDSAKVQVIYPGVTQLAPMAHIGADREQMILYVGSLFNRRHIPELIEAFARLARRRTDARLEIVGDNRTRPHLDIESVVKASGAADRIRVRPYASDQDLADLYRRARAFAFLSAYEGFGMTPLDALAAGVPILVLDTAVAREVYGAAAIYAERPDPAVVENGLERLLFDDAERARLLEESKARLARYSWRACAQHTLDVLLACAAR